MCREAGSRDNHNPLCVNHYSHVITTELVPKGLPLVGYTWWPFFSLLDRACREGEKPVEDHLWHMGIYDLEPDGRGDFSRIETPVVRAFQSVVERRSER